MEENIGMVQLWYTAQNCKKSWHDTLKNSILGVHSDRNLEVQRVNDLFGINWIGNFTCADNCLFDWQQLFASRASRHQRMIFLRFSVWPLLARRNWSREGNRELTFVSACRASVWVNRYSPLGWSSCLDLYRWARTMRTVQPIGQGCQSLPSRIAVFW